PVRGPRGGGRHHARPRADDRAGGPARHRHRRRPGLVRGRAGPPEARGRAGRGVAGADPALPGGGAGPLPPDPPRVPRNPDPAVSPSPDAAPDPAPAPGPRPIPAPDAASLPDPTTYVSRGALKLHAAIAAFGIDPAGRVCADLGCSTGGFTDCWLRHGAARVYAVDTAYG